VALLLRRGFLHARLGQWKPADDDYTRAIELDPDAHDGWYELAAVRLQMGDLDGHRRHCQDMLRRFGRTSDPFRAERTAKACLIVPDTVADREQVVRMTEQALQLPLSTDQKWAYTWFLVSRGMADCRAGRPRQAIDWIEKGLQQSEGTPPVYEALSRLFLSMAYHQLKENDKAREALGEAVRVIDQKLPKAESGDLEDSWLDWVFCQVVRRETEKLIGGPAPGSKKRDPER
jgi:eukaryotic-like serine/threonine-protein kinase